MPVDITGIIGLPYVPSKERCGTIHNPYHITLLSALIIAVPQEVPSFPGPTNAGNEVDSPQAGLL